MRKIIILSVLMLVAIGLGFGWRRAHHPVHPPRVNASEYESDMTEALVRGILRGLGPSAPGICFLAFGEGRTPPSWNFLARFNGTRPAVQSCHSAVSPPIGKYFDRNTGRPGLMLHIIKIKEFIPLHYDVVVSLSNLPSGHDHFVYRLSGLGGEWKIEGCQPE